MEHCTVLVPNANCFILFANPSPFIGLKQSDAFITGSEEGLSVWYERNNNAFQLLVVLFLCFVTVKCTKGHIIE